jgi:hypothetical protein
VNRTDDRVCISEHVIATSNVVYKTEKINNPGLFCVYTDNNPGRREFTIPDLITSNADFDSRVFRMSSPSYKLEQTNDSPPGQYYRVKHHKTWTEIETDIMQCFLSDSNYYLGYLL